MEIQDRVNLLMQNEEFAAAFGKAANAREVVDLFAAKGVEVPLETAQELFEPLIPDGEELDEESLEDVSGGGGIGTYVGTAIGNGVFYGAGYLGARLAKWDKKKAKKYASACGKFGATLGAAIGTLIPV